MQVGARTPEELETLFEDACVLRDPRALVQLFEADALLVLGERAVEARGRWEIARVAAESWDLGRTYLADPLRVLQVRDTALVLARSAVNVVRRAEDGSWRYTISVAGLEETTAERARVHPFRRLRAKED